MRQPNIRGQHIHGGEQKVPVMDGISAEKTRQWKLLRTGIGHIGRKIVQTFPKPAEAERRCKIIFLPKKLPNPVEGRDQLGQRAARYAHPHSQWHEKYVPKLMHAKIQEIQRSESIAVPADFN